MTLKEWWDEKAVNKVTKPEAGSFNGLMLIVIIHIILIDFLYWLLWRSWHE